MGLIASLFVKSAIATPVALLAVMTFKDFQSSVEPQVTAMETRNCASRVQVMAEATIAQRGKTKAIGQTAIAESSAQASQATKTRLPNAENKSFVSYVRCLPDQN